MEKEYFDCTCSLMEHTVRFTYDPVDNELYSEIHMDSSNSLWKRICLATRYIFGKSCNYGHYGNWILQEEDCTRLVELVNKVKEKDNLTSNKVVGTCAPDFTNT